MRFPFHFAFTGTVQRCHIPTWGDVMFCQATTCNRRTNRIRQGHAAWLFFLATTSKHCSCAHFVDIVIIDENPTLVSQEMRALCRVHGMNNRRLNQLTRLSRTHCAPFSAPSIFSASIWITTFLPARINTSSSSSPTSGAFNRTSPASTSFRNSALLANWTGRLLVPLMCITPRNLDGSTTWTLPSSAVTYNRKWCSAAPGNCI